MATAILSLLLVASPAAAQERDDVPPPEAQERDDVPPSGVWGGIEYFATALASDAWAVTTAPLNLSRRDALVAGGVLAIGVVLYAFEEPIYEEIRRSRTDGFWAEVEDLGETLDPVALMGETNKYYAAGVVGGYALDGLTGNEEVRHLFEELLISHWIAGALRKGIGRPIGRMRPEQGFGPYHFSFWDGSSFPSGHASTITQVAAVLSHHIDWWPATALLHGGAAAVVYERVSSGKHWASDSWLGAAWGWGVAQVVIRRREADTTTFLPILRPDADGVALEFRIPVGGASTGAR